MKKAKTPEVEREHALLLRCKAHTEAEKPLREMELTAEEKKLIRGFVFLSQKPILYVLNISESTTLGADLDAAVAKYGLTEVAARPTPARPRSAARWKPSSPRWTMPKPPNSSKATA